MSKLRRAGTRSHCSSLVLLRKGLIFERLYPFLEHLVELSGRIAQLVWISLVEDSLPKSVYLCLIHCVNSLPLGASRETYAG